MQVKITRKSTSSQRICSTVLSIGVVSLIVTTATSAADSVGFPGKVSEAKSPNTLYTIKNFDYPEGNVNYPNHVLFFLRKGQKKGLALNVHQQTLGLPGVGTYNRSVEILWSPDSSAFALNDWEGSNVASVYLYRVHDLKHPIKPKLWDALSKRDKRRIAKSHCIYWSARRWISPTMLELKVYADAQGTGTLHYLWDLRKNSFKFVRRVFGEDAD